MSITLHLEQLNKTYNTNHPPSKIVNPILPFVINNVVELRGGFDDLVGEYVRHICGHSIHTQDKENDELKFEDPLILQLTSQIEYKTEAQEDLERFFRHFLYGTNRSMNVFHPYVYNFLPDPENDNPRKKENLRKYAAFISDVLVGDDHKVAEIFKDKKADDLLTELILDNLKVVPDTRKEKVKHQSLLPFLSSLYREDLLFMNKHRDYFLSHFSLLTHFYAFIYVCQLLFKFEQFCGADYSQATPLYFALEWEALSKRRKATEELGYRAIKEKLPHLFVHVHTMTQLSMLSEDEGQPFLTYSDLDNQLLTESDRANYIKSINQWIPEYVKKFSLNGEDETIITYSDLEKAVKGLFHRIQKGVNHEAAVKYGKNIPGFGGKTFIKSRSSLGHVFNMTQEMLLLLTAVCVKESRMPLKKLFIEFSRRGVEFDRLSKKVIIELFDALNILDKKSDSGDAHYVKSIL